MFQRGFFKSHIPPCPQFLQPGLYIPLVTPLFNPASKILLVFFLYLVLITPLLCLKTTLNSTLSSEINANSKATLHGTLQLSPGPAYLSKSSLFFADSCNSLAQHLLHIQLYLSTKC